MTAVAAALGGGGRIPSWRFSLYLFFFPRYEEEQGVWGFCVKEERSLLLDVWYTHTYTAANQTRCVCHPQLRLAKESQGMGLCYSVLWHQKK
jgi:hypothetical protein